MWESLPAFGTGVLYAVLVSASFTFAVSVAAGRGQPRLLTSARLAAYGTSAMVLLGVLLLAYAFITHDFRLRYVAHYSDRSMTDPYLITSLWGGQDGSLLWWTFLLSIYIAACIRWMKGRYRVLQPYVIATLMAIVGFFAILMVQAANPFATSVAGGTLDGEGLNPMLQNFYMIIHPPSLYIGFVGCSIPFAFAIAALITGRLTNEWVVATRKWMLFAWLFLTFGNALGMLWAYVELGWGGYWAWDPVENAAILPWFTATAYVHSTMIQERRGMFKVWNIFLIITTFFLTIFGTFLTRSGMIASVHAFAQSDIGTYFVGFMGVIIVVSAALMIWRLPQLRADNTIESLASREAMFVINNWVLLGVATLVLGFTMWPKISDWILSEEQTIGPQYFNRWLGPLGILVYALMGLAPLFAWRKTSEDALKRSFAVPLALLFGTGIVHYFAGDSLGYPAVIEKEQLSPGFAGLVLKHISQVMPLLVVSLSVFNLSVIFREFARGIAARRRNTDENVISALFGLVSKNRRRYGGYIVHTGIVLMFMGFVGSDWGVDKEVTLKPGESFQIAHYDVKYIGPRMEVDRTKRMIFADLEVYDISGGRSFAGKSSPAKFIYRKQQMPTTEVSLISSFKDDFYAILGNANPKTKSATFHFHVNVLVNWIWLGVFVMMAGAGLSLWPDVSLKELGAWGYVRVAAGAATGIMFSLALAASPSTAHANYTVQGSTVRAHSPPADAALAPGESQTPALPAGSAPLGGLLLGLGAVFTLNRRRKRDL